VSIAGSGTQLNSTSSPGEPPRGVRPSCSPFHFFAADDRRLLERQVMSVIFFGFFFVFALPLTIFYLWALVDALRTPASAWQAAEQNQLLWVGVMIFATVLGAVLYVLIARPKLAEVHGNAEPASAIR
jgi:hypothetical protein